MSENLIPLCTECDDVESFDRRDFIRLLGGSAAGAVVLSSLTPVSARAETKKSEKTEKAEKKDSPAEALVKELFAGLKDDQKKLVVFPWTDKRRRALNPNGSIATPIGKVYTKTQSELIERIIKAMCSGEEGWKQISRDDGKSQWDNSHKFENIGAHIFGDPSKDKFAFMITGHHLTIRCDGDSDDGPAWGGPIYYGHTPNGWSERNLFYYQTKAAMSVHNALSEKQKKLAIFDAGSDERKREGEYSVRFKKPEERKPGLSYGEMSKDQQGLLETVMRTILSPFRKEDADEVMQIIKTNGGFDKLHLGFFKDAKTKEGQWDFWRIEGPGFVWNFRVLPHVHCYVNISTKVNS
jgi:hypothetical protein